MVISFLNQKGGVGKTTLALHVAVGLQMQGRGRGLVIDADLHQRMKVACVLAGTDMTTVLIELLEERFPPES